jgi:hypothetical protein
MEGISISIGRLIEAAVLLTPVLLVVKARVIGRLLRRLLRPAWQSKAR